MSATPKHTADKSMRSTRPTITEAKSRHEGSLMKIAGVEGVALGECRGEPAIVVYVVRRSAAVLRRIPRTLEGFPVTVEVSGRFIAQ